MATVHMPNDLLAQLQAKATAQGKTVDELAEEALRASVKPPTWEELLTYGQERARHAGMTDEKSAADIVHEWRKGR